MSTHQPLILTLKALEYFQTSISKGHSIKIDNMLSELFEKNNVDVRTRRIAYARTMDVVRRIQWAKQLVDSLLSRKCPPDIYLLLLIGATEICYPPRPAQATINQLSNYAKNFHPKFGSFVYGVLKNIERSPPVGYQAHCPTWILDQLNYSEIEREVILDAWMMPPTLFIRCHPWRISKAEFTQTLLTDNISFEQTPLGWYITTQIPVTEIPGYHEGIFYVQDEHAAMVDLWYEQIEGELWDACAAPGGKTLASLAFNKIKTFASDRQSKRLRLLEHNITRSAPLYSPTVQQLDASEALEPMKLWDAILLDVPCSGSGVFSKHPESKWAFTESELNRHVSTQMSILNNAWDHLKEGGEILYMTCSLFKSENENQIRSFLERHSQAKLLPIQDKDENIGTTFLPKPGYSGGFYMARITKSTTT